MGTCQTASRIENYSCKWVYKKKECIPGVEDARFKIKSTLNSERLHPKGSIDFNEVFSPVVRHTSIHVSLALVALYDLEWEQLDVKIVFLHGELKEEIYIQQPMGLLCQERRIVFAF